MEKMNLNGFKVIPLKYDKNSKAHHYLYMKEYSVKEIDECKPQERTLIILNVPPYCTQSSLRNMFSDYGKVLNVCIHSKPEAGPPQKNISKLFPTVDPVKGFKVAYIVFSSPVSVQNVLKLPCDKPLILTNDDRKVLTGVRKWCKEYERKNIVDVKKMQTEIDEFMSNFDRLQEEEKNKAKEQEGVPDDDGWITVTRHGKNKGAPRTEIHEKRITARQKKRRKEMELLNFYRFQLRESKMEKLAQLRKKFEEDKHKIALMKESRRFKPY